MWSRPRARFLPGLLLGLSLFVRPAVAEPARTNIPAMVAHALQSVVNISVWSTNAADVPNSSRAAAKSPRHDNRIYGSGLIVGADGIIVTNRHVIDGAETISVVMPDQSRLPARVIAVASLVDLALLKVDVDHALPALEFADSDRLQVGQRAFAIGNPLGVGTSVSEGIVSAINRNIMDSPFDDFVQTDASINHGDSGGPLVDAAGQVIGINTLLRTPDGSTGSVGIGFAIPSNDVAYVIGRMENAGPAQPGWIGLRLQDTTPEMGEALGMLAARGAVVTAVTASGPAAQAGLQPGDIIVGIADQLQVDARAVLRAAARTDIGDALTLTVWRNGQERSVPVRVALWPRLPQDKVSKADMTSPEPPGLGITLAAITPALRRRYGIDPKDQGVVVTAVDERSDARDRGMGPGNVITQVQLAPVRTLAEANGAIDAARQQGRSFVMLLIAAKSGPLWVPLALGASRRTSAKSATPGPVVP